MKTRKHSYGKIRGLWCVFGVNGHIVTSDIKTESMAQRIARGLDLELMERREAKR